MLFRLVANALDARFSKGDAIAIDMPMTVHAVIIYLAIVLAGFVVVSIADSFSANEVAVRLRISNAKGIFTQVILLKLLKLKKDEESLPCFCYNVLSLISLSDELN